MEAAVVGSDADSGAGTAAERWEPARGLLRRMEERAHRVRAVPVAGSSGSGVRDDVLPVVEPLAGLLPGGGLRRGGTVAVPAGAGATSLLLALLARASAAGAWIGVVGRPELGLVAAAEAGLRLERVALVPHPGTELVAATAALLDGLDVVAVAGAERAGVRATDRQRLAARARQRGAVLVSLGGWPGADVELTCTDLCWEGPAAGAGRLRVRRARAWARGGGLPPAGRSATLVLPDVPSGKRTEPGLAPGSGRVTAGTGTAPSRPHIPAARPGAVQEAG